ncbi:MAG TPA: VCBS repeat-containing protein [Tepidisphaeraceae bacterium]|nr:VCBS repeat-containing protein [Tepidisphaeraceae bacterium]
MPLSSGWVVRFFANRGKKRRAARQVMRHCGAEALESRMLLTAAPVSFLTQQFFRGAFGPRGVVADFSNNGRPDIVVVNELYSTVSVLLNTGDGAFLPPVHYSVLNARDVAVGDFNHDGNLDMAVLSANGPYSTIKIFYGLANGSFLKPINVPLHNGGVTLSAADVNGDGLPDLVVSGGVDFGIATDVNGNPLPNQPGPNAFAGQKVLVLTNLGNGVFSKPVRYRAGNFEARDLITADFNGDGLPDVAVLRSQDQFAVLLGQKNVNGTGVLGPPVTYAAGSNPRGIAAGDFNHDGKLDLVVANSDFLTPTLKVYLGNGDGTFAAGQNYFGGNFVDSVAVGDFNGDGNLDIATSSFTSALRIYPGNGDGTFGPPQSFASGQFGNFVLAGDFNGDGKTDVAVISTYGTHILLAGSSAAPPPNPSVLDATLGGGGSRTLTYLDAGGARATLSLAGPGSAVVHFIGGGLSVNRAGNQIIGGPAALGSIVATGTTAASALAIKVIGKNGRVDVGSISTDGSFQSIIAPTTNLRGDATIAGAIGRIVLNDVTNGTFRINGAGRRVDLSLGIVNDESLFSASPIHSLAVSQWTSPTNGAEQINAPAIGAVASTGEFSPDLTIGPGGLGTLNARTIAGGNYAVAGKVGGVHSMRSAMFTLSAASLGSLSAVDLLNNVTLNIAGNIGSITAGALYNSNVFAGVGPLPPGQRFPITSSNFTNVGATIKSVFLHQGIGNASFLNSAISAPNIGNANLGTVAFANNGAPQGIAAHSIALVSGSDLITRKIFALRHPTNTSGLAARGINPQDFVILGD